MAAVGEADAAGPRRAFLENREIPGLVLGTARAEPAACRRVLGARRGGRVGFVLALAGLALASPTLAFAANTALAHVLLTLCTGLAQRRLRSHTTKEVQRLALWAALTPICVAALGRPLVGTALVPVAVCAAQLLLWRALAVTR